jgi:UDP-glucose 4-epimerase
MILVTGATGFVGSALVKRILSDNISSGIVVAMRRPDESWTQEGVKSVLVGDLLPTTDWSRALVGVDAVIHCAARVHVMQERSKDPLKEYREVNTLATLCLAQQAADAGVRRFVYVSSIKVNGEATLPGCPVTAEDKPSPQDPYAISKWEAEQGLHAIAQKSGMEVTIVRPPLVYGLGVRANFGLMMRWLSFGVPLPLGSITNLRSLVALDNLVDLLITCVCHPSAASETFLVSDGEDISTSELLRRTARAMGVKAWLFPVPASWIIMIATIFGRKALAQRLCGNLQLDIEKTRRILDWNPPVKLDESLSKIVENVTK